MHRIQYIFFSAIMFLLPAGSVMAGSSWPLYQQAVALFRSGTSPAKVQALCRTVLNNSNDQVLRARTRFLLSDSYAHEGDFQKAQGALQEILHQSALPSGLSDVAKLRQARLYRQSGNNSAAIEVLESVAREGANIFTCKEARLGLAEMLSQASDWQRADSLLELVQTGQLTGSQNEERILILQARKALVQGQPDSAIGFLEGRSSERALFMLARAYRLAGQVVQSAQMYKQIEDVYPQKAEKAMYEAGNLFFSVSDWSAAADQFDRLLAHFPEGVFSQPARFRHGLSLLRAGKPEAALTALRRAGRTVPDLRFDYLQAECLRTLLPEQRREAIALYRQVAALRPDSQLGKASILRVAALLFEANRLEDGIITLKQYLSLHPKDPSGETVSFVLTEYLPSAEADSYFQRILEGDRQGRINNASLASLQNRDYLAGRYMEVVSRAGQYAAQLQEGNPSYWRRVNHLLLAETSYYLQNYDLAAQNYEAAAGAAEDDISWNASLGQAWLHVQTGDLAQAAEMFEQLTLNSSGDNHSRALFGLAAVHFRLHHFERAIDAYRALTQSDQPVQDDSMHVKALFRLAQSYAGLDYMQDAIAAWQDVVDRFPDTRFAPRSEFEIAEAYFRANHFEQARTTFEKFLTNYSGHVLAPTCALRRAQCDFNAGDYDAAISAFHQFLSNYPTHDLADDALAGLQNSYFQLGRQQEAVGALLDLVSQYPESMLSAEARLLVGANYVDLKKYDEARRTYKEIVVRYPGTSYAVDAQLALAQSFYHSGNDEAAVAEFTQFLTYFPESEQADEAFFDLGVSYFNLENFEQANAKFAHLISHYPDSRYYSAALQNAGWCYDKLGETGQALQLFKRYLAQNTEGQDTERVQLEMARLLGLQGQAAESRRMFRALGKSADDGVATEAAFRLGLAYLALQRQDDARQAFEQAMQQGKADDYYRLSAISQLAALYEGEQNWEQALAMYKLLMQATSEKAWTTAALERIDAIADLVAETAK